MEGNENLFENWTEVEMKMTSVGNRNCLDGNGRKWESKIIPAELYFYPVFHEFRLHFARISRDLTQNCLDQRTPNRQIANFPDKHPLTTM